MATLGVVVYSVPGMTDLSRCLDSVQWAETISVHALEVGSERQAGKLPAKGSMDTDWILHLWGDEQVEAGLAAELRNLCQAPPAATPSLYYVPVRSLLLGRWIKGSLWSPAPSPRLCRAVQGFPDHWWNVPSTSSGNNAGLLRGWVSDYSCANLQTAMERINVVSSLWADRLRSQNRAPGQWAAAAHSIQVFLRLLFVKGLLLQGMAGMSLATFAAYTTLVSAMKCHEEHSLGRL